MGWHTMNATCGAETGLSPRTGARYSHPVFHTARAVGYDLSPFGLGKSRTSRAGPRPSAPWQAGYGAFTVSGSRAADVAAYIAAQQEHHRRVSYQEEFLTFLRKHGLVYDERDLWS
jgi:hypothetical protein